MASAIHGVDAHLQATAEAFAAKGFIAAAPDLFLRKVPGRVERGDARSTPRGRPRLEVIRTDEADLADILIDLRKLARFDGRAATMGFCYRAPIRISDRSVWAGRRHLGAIIATSIAAVPALVMRGLYPSQRWTIASTESQMRVRVSLLRRSPGARYRIPPMTSSLRTGEAETCAYYGAATAMQPGKWTLGCARRSGG